MWHPGALSSLLVTSNRYSRVHCLGRCWCHGFPIVEGGTETLKKTTKRGLVLEGRYDKLIHVYRFPWNLKGFPLLNATFLAEVVWGRYNLTRFFFFMLDMFTANPSGWKNSLKHFDRQCNMVDGQSCLYSSPKPLLGFTFSTYPHLAVLDPEKKITEH